MKKSKLNKLVDLKIKILKLRMEGCFFRCYPKIALKLFREADLLEKNYLLTMQLLSELYCSYMIHDHQNTKEVGIRDFQQNIYQNLPDPGSSTVITSRGQAMYVVSALSVGDGGGGGTKGVSNEDNSKFHTR